MIIKKIKPWIKNRYTKIINYINGIFGEAWVGGKYTIIVFVIIISSITGFYLGTGFGKGVDILITLFIGILGTLLSKLIVKILLKLINEIPIEFLSIMIPALIALTIGINSILKLPVYLAFLLALAIALAESFLGIGLWLLFKNKKKRILASVLVIVTLAINIAAALEIKNSGESNEEFNKYISTYMSSLEKLEANKRLDDPSKEGNYKVNTLFYGSGKDKHRSEYGEKVDIITRGVYAYSLLENYIGIEGKLRTKYWGFDDRDMPINGRVWYPEGEGKFPLILMVHGNHRMEEFSDGGYEYLGKLLASQGFIAVSVDENFLNAAWFGDLGGENDARAWILLKHLDTWKRFNGEENNVFYNKVDFDNIALIGHSRGGEAVAIASLFNKLKYYPKNANIKFNFDYNIKSIIAIAPTDGQYKPADNPTQIKNVDYLLIQGANDGDVSTFMGSSQYDRVKFDDGKYHFKSSLYVYGANHGQFNTIWGNMDVSKPFGLYLNLKPLISGEEQRKIAQIYISAFLRSSLKGEREYISLFRDYKIGGNILPKTMYVNRFKDSNFKLISNYEEDANIETASISGGIQSTERIYTWKEKQLRFRKDNLRDSNVVDLKWIGNGGKYSIDLPEDIIYKWEINNNSKFVFSACDIDENKLKDNSFKVTDFTLKLTDSNGEEALVPLSSIGRLHPPVGVKLSKWDYHNKKVYGEEFETVLQDFEIPMKEFIKSNPKFSPKNLKKIEFIFDKSSSGNIVIDDIGIEI